MRRCSRTLWVALGRSGTLLGRSGALWDARRRAARIRSGAKLVPLQILNDDISLEPSTAGQGYRLDQEDQSDTAESQRD